VWVGMDTKYFTVSSSSL